MIWLTLRLEVDRPEIVKAEIESGAVVEDHDVNREGSASFFASGKANCIRSGTRPAAIRASNKSFNHSLLNDR
jgi:hypothetical protein